MPDPIIGFVGLGRMGGPMAGRLLDAGYALSVYDTQSETMAPLGARGAHLAKSPADVASSSDIVLASLPTPDIVKAVALGATASSKAPARAFWSTCPQPGPAPPRSSRRA